MSAQPMTDPQPMGPDPSKCGSPKPKHPGEFCGLPAGWGTDHPGIGRCKLHFGATRNHRESARLKLMALVDPAVAQLQRLLNDPEVADHVKLATARDILDRAGFVPPRRIEHSGPEGGPIPVEHRQAQLLERLRQIESGEIIDVPIAGDEGL